MGVRDGNVTLTGGSNLGRQAIARTVVVPFVALAACYGGIVARSVTGVRPIGPGGVTRLIGYGAGFLTSGSMGIRVAVFIRGRRCDSALVSGVRRRLVVCRGGLPRGSRGGRGPLRTEEAW